MAKFIDPKKRLDVNNPAFPADVHDVNMILSIRTLMEIVCHFRTRWHERPNGQAREAHVSVESCVCFVCCAAGPRVVNKKISPPKTGCWGGGAGGWGDLLLGTILAIATGVRCVQSNAERRPDGQCRARSRCPATCSCRDPCSCFQQPNLHILPLYI